MSVVTREIEIDKDNYIEVSFHGNAIIEDASYSDEFGLVKFPKYEIVEDITWNTEVYSHKENNMIDKYLNEHYSSVEQEIIEKEKSEF